MDMCFRDLRHQKIKSGIKNPNFGFDLASIKSEMAMEKIDEDYLESHFQKVIPILISGNSSEIDSAIKIFKAELPKLSEVHQKYAHDIISDIQNGELIIDENKTLMQYIR